MASQTEFEINLGYLGRDRWKGGSHQAREEAHQQRMKAFLAEQKVTARDVRRFGREV